MDDLYGQGGMASVHLTIYMGYMPISSQYVKKQFLSRIKVWVCCTVWCVLPALMVVFRN